jgi:hypothetical protein
VWPDLSEFTPFWAMFIPRPIYFEFGIHFYHKSNVLHLTNRCVWATFWALWGGCWVIKPQKHLAALLSSEAVKETFETKF